VVATESCDSLITTEPNHGELDLISPFGLIRRVSDISASEGHIVPTSVFYRLDPFRGTIEVFASGFTTIEGITFDRRGRLYVLESMTAPGFPGPGEAGTGTIVRVDHHGVVESIATGLSFPTAMTFGWDSKLYVSNFGFAVPPGTGQIVRVDLPQEDY
jgi:hypothetical protein